MSTLFDSYYDSLGHELHIGEYVMGVTSGGKIYGTIVEINLDSKGNEKYTIIPNIGSNNISNLKKKYKIGYKNVYLINAHKKI